MEFGNKEFVPFFIIPFVIFFIALLGLRKKDMILKIMNYTYEKKKDIFRICLYTIGSILLVVSLLSPQIASKKEKQEVKGGDIYILIDTSRSMMAEDIYPNRLQRSKEILKNILQNLKGDRVGFIPFSDSAYIQMPLTDDYRMAENYLEAIDSQLISGGGTKLIEALKIAGKSFENSGADERTVLIVSDGGDKDGELLEYAEKSKLNIFAIGIGGDEFVPIPEYVRGEKKGFIRDSSGNLATTKLNGELLKNLAKAGYYKISNLQDNSENFLRDAKKLKKEIKRKEIGQEYKKYFQIPLFLAFLFIFLGFFLRGGLKDE
ncbi:MAG: vWA domain-containing protein, partial [Fusobacteriaceae bacterium]